MTAEEQEEILFVKKLTNKNCFKVKHKVTTYITGKTNKKQLKVINTLTFSKKRGSTGKSNSYSKHVINFNQKI